VPAGDADDRRAQALAALRVEPRLAGVSVVAVHRDGVAQVAGHVASRLDYELAARLVRGAPGVSRVCNTVQIGLPRQSWPHG
jgi:osmotically-inducible protein OsmY